MIGYWGTFVEPLDVQRCALMLLGKLFLAIRVETLRIEGFGRLKWEIRMALCNTCGIVMNNIFLATCKDFYEQSYS